MDDLAVFQELTFDDLDPTEGLYIFVQSPSCRRRVLAAVFENPPSRTCFIVVGIAYSTEYKGQTTFIRIHRTLLRHLLPRAARPRTTRPSQAEWCSAEDPVRERVLSRSRRRTRRVARRGIRARRSQLVPHTVIHPSRRGRRETSVSFSAHSGGPYSRLSVPTLAFVEPLWQRSHSSSSLRRSHYCGTQQSYGTSHSTRERGGLSQACPRARWRPTGEATTYSARYRWCPRRTPR